MYDGRRLRRLQANERIIIHLAQSDRTTTRHQRALCVNNATRYGDAMACWWHWPLHVTLYVTSLPVSRHVTAARGQAMVKRWTIRRVTAGRQLVSSHFTLRSSVWPTSIYFRSRGTSNGLPVHGSDVDIPPVTAPLIYSPLVFAAITPK